MINTKISRREAVVKTAVAAAGVGVALSVVTNGSVAQAAEAEDRGVLKALITAERNAIKTYEAGKGVIDGLAFDGGSMDDPLTAYRGVVVALALHYRAQHVDHEAILVEYYTQQGGSMADLPAGQAQVPAGFVGNIKNVIDLATNAEKAAAVAYTGVQKSLTLAKNANLAAAIGADETQHFVALQLVANGFVVPADAAKGQDAAPFADIVKKFAPKSFVVTIGAREGLDKVADYDVTQ